MSEEIARLRPMSAPTNRFQFGAQTITTRVFVMAPRGMVTVAPYVDVTAALDETDGRTVSLTVNSADPFADVEV